MDRQDATRRFYTLVWPHAQLVLRAAHYLVRGAAEADDVAQETMLKAFRAIDTFQDGTDARAWLMTILRNTRIDHFRDAAPRAADVSLQRLGEEPAGGGGGCGSNGDGRHVAWDDPDALMESFGDDHVIAALHRLPEEIRWTLLLVDVEGMDHADAAAVLDVPVGTVKSRAFRGRAMLRDALVPVAREMRLI